MKPGLLIVLEDGAKAVAVARVNDPALLRLAAQTAITEKRQEAEALSREDGALALVASEEAERLERTLSALIPTETSAAVM